MALCQVWSCQETWNTLLSGGILITRNKNSCTRTHTQHTECSMGAVASFSLSVEVRVGPPVIPTEEDKGSEEKRGRGGGERASSGIPLHAYSPSDLSLQTYPPLYPLSVPLSSSPRSPHTSLAHLPARCICRSTAKKAALIPPPVALFSEQNVQGWAAVSTISCKPCCFFKHVCALLP